MSLPGRIMAAALLASPRLSEGGWSAGHGNHSQAAASCALIGCSLGRVSPPADDVIVARTQTGDTLPSPLLPEKCAGPPHLLVYETFT